MPTTYNDRLDDNSESDVEPLGLPFGTTMGMWPSKDSFTSTLGKWVTAPQLIPTSVQILHPEDWNVYIVSEEEDELEPVPLAPKKASD